MMRPKVFVVEGKNDASRMKTFYPDIYCVSTNGSAIALDALILLEKLDETHDIILCLDPDYAGERIRRILSNKLTHVFHAFIDKDQALSKNEKKVGFEHASKETIDLALSHLHMNAFNSTSDITYAFLHEMKLIGHQDSTKIRNKLSMIYHLGYVNGKTLYQRLHMFGITKKDVIEVLK